MFQPNSVIAGRYHVVRLVGQGGMSNLYLAYDRKYNNATVVVKEMTASYADPKEQQMAVDLFHREAKLLASLNHRHIPKVYDYFQFAGKYYLSMEYIDGGDLAVQLEEKNGPLPEKQVLEWGEQIATVLFYLHKHEPPIVFRDVKPSNIMISSKGVKLIDFGIARHFDQAKKGDTMRIGSPGYAPPEQYAAQTDPRSDIYALGVTLHHALTGRDPTATNTPFLVPPARDLNPALSEGTAAMLARATQLDPSDRYQSALEMKKDIKHILQRSNQSTRVVGAPPALPSQTGDSSKQASTPATPQDKKAAAAAAAATVAAAAATVAGASSSSTPAPQSGNNAAASSTASPATNANAASVTTSPNPTGSTSGPTPATPNKPAQPPKKKTKKGSSLAKFLLAATVFTASAAGTGYALTTEEQRAQLLEKAGHYASSFVQEFQAQDDPETKLRGALISSSPEALLPLFQSPDFKSLSSEKQELFRLNLLAAASNQSTRVLHLLVPRTGDDPMLWAVASQAMESANSDGGFGRELLVILPEYYTPGALNHKLARLTQDESASQNFLIVGADQESVGEDIAEKALFLSTQDLSDRRTVRRLAEDSSDLETLFHLDLDASAPPSVWAIPGPVPAGATESQDSVSSPLTAESLSGALNQAESLGGRVLALAEDAQAASELSQAGKLHLLATTPGQLPALGEGLTGTASVLSSPFEDSSLLDPVHPSPLGDTPLSLEQARLYDSIILASLPPDKAFQGLTIARSTDGSYQAKKTIPYRWNGKSWLPNLSETGKSE